MIFGLQLNILLLGFKMTIKKRNIFTIILTILVLIISNKLWLTFEPIEVGIKLNSRYKIGIDAQLNKKPDSKFKNYKSKLEYFDFSKLSQAVLHIDRSKHPRALRLRLFIGFDKERASITISNIKINNYEIRNLKNVEVIGANILNVDNDSLIIKPDNSVVILTFLETFNVFSEFKINY